MKLPSAFDELSGFFHGQVPKGDPVFDRLASILNVIVQDALTLKVQSLEAS